MTTNNVTLRQLRAFLAIADAGSFAAAARRLHLKPAKATGWAPRDVCRA